MNRIISIFLCYLIYNVSFTLADATVEAILLVKTSPSTLFRLENPKFVQDHVKLISKVIFLCPIENPIQSDHAVYSSWTTSPLFIKEIASAEQIKDKTTPTCFHAFDLGIMINTEKKYGNYYEIGYEIDLGSQSNQFHPSQKFDKLKTLKGTYFKPEEAVKGHIWISVLNVVMKQKCKYAQQIFYEITNGEYTIEDTTKKHFLLFNEIKFLKKFNWDELLQKTNDQQLERVEGYKKGEKLVLQKLAPLEDFNSYGKRLAAYHYLNNSAMWSSIASNSWKKVQNYVRQIAKEFGRLQITTGILGKQTLHPDSNDSWWRKSPEILSLVDNENIIPVPSIFWKLVQFEYKWQRYGEDVQFAILIITYNNPFTEISPLDGDCSISFCQINNWHIASDNIYEGIIHCCPINENILKTLNLKNFPQFYNHFNIDSVRMLNNGEDKNARKIVNDKNNEEFAQ